MENTLNLQKTLNAGPDEISEYECAVKDLLDDGAVLSMRRFIQHGQVTCLEHCLRVSFLTYRICRSLGLDSRSAARGALLHDMFLYDWHEKNSCRGLHGFTHPKTALDNALRRFELNDKERDVIRKHMWPLTPALPKYGETLVVTFADKCCTVGEVRKNLERSRQKAKLAPESR